MKTFCQQHDKKIIGTISIFDRLIFKGYLPINYPEAMEKFVDRQGWLRKEMAEKIKACSRQVKVHAMTMTENAGCPYKYFGRKIDKDATAKSIIRETGVTEGLACVIAVNEQNPSFALRYAKGRPRIKKAWPGCLTLYFYFLDREFGLIHVRLSTWFPFHLQVYVNGHEWLAKKLDAAGIGYRKIENSFVQIDDPEKAQEIADRFGKIKWEKRLHMFARRVNPMLRGLLRGMEYYWVADQAEYATDLMFKQRGDLKELYKKLQSHAAVSFSAEDILGFLGRKLNGNFQGEVTSDFKVRRQGGRVKHRMKGNWIKMYDKQGVVLRIETVINHPHEFLAWRHGTRHGEPVEGWFPMCKRVSNLYRYAEVSLAANARYLEALSVVDDPSRTVKELGGLCERARLGKRKHRGLNPLKTEDRQLFRAVLRGENFIRGFRNSEVAKSLGVSRSSDPAERRRRSARVGRRIQLLRAHGLVAKIPRTRRYKVTMKGHRLMSRSLEIYESWPNDASGAIAA